MLFRSSGQRARSKLSLPTAMSNDPEERRSSKDELFARADRACAETQLLIRGKASALAVKELGTPRPVAPFGVDPRSVAKRYLAEGQHHIAVQLVRLAQLDRHGHAKLAAKARDLLVLLEGSLRLVRQHLARIERENDAGVYGPFS